MKKILVINLNNVESLKSYKNISVKFSKKIKYKFIAFMLIKILSIYNFCEILNLTSGNLVFLDINSENVDITIDCIFK